ncbi:hypothetical protein FSP39_019322 [Pinctada imbricata]|uniref:Homeobox domain-containing protein n=1 Tax=Pinctada imbricata TaxID=66713 RepID=A0AA89BL14_PINIB|nr:hypothetical protein FSP39_019322 [Pinctada imbricata]
MQQSLDVCKKTTGKIWHRKPTPSVDNGLMISITNSQSGPLSQPGRNIRFLHTSFDSHGDSFVAGDHQGHVYLFDINKNRFSLVQKTGHPCTALAFSLRRKTEFLIGLSDYSLKCFDTDTQEMVAWMKGHESAIHNISVHASGRYALTSSHDTAQLWDLDTFQRKRKLNIKENVGIVQVFFLPMSNTIITGFKDDTIFGWESDTLNCKYQLPVPPGNTPHYKAYAITRDGRILAAGGKSRFIHLWDLDTHRLLRIVELPNKVTTVKQLIFLPDNFDAGANQTLGVLSQDGIIRFINITTCKLLFDVGTVDNRINNASVSNSGRHLVAVMEDGSLNVYNVHTLSEELSKPPAPLVKVVTNNKMSETMSTDKSTVGTKKSAKSRAKGKENMEDVKAKEIPDSLNMERLKAILKGYGEYPAKYRMFIWRSILRLPENHTAYAALVDKGTHPAYAKIQEEYPVKSRKLLRILQRVLSALAHWSPIFGETQYLPVLAFPFIKLFQNNHLVCFEIIATYMVNWGSHWFEYFPNPPINILAMIENVLAHHDKYLLQHFVNYRVTSQAALASDCFQASVPYALCSDESVADKDSGPMIDPSLTAAQEADLQSQFLEVGARSNPKVQELQSFYNTQLAQIETQRLDAVAKVTVTNFESYTQYQSEMNSVQAYHDRQRMHLTNRVTGSLQLLKIAMPRDSQVTTTTQKPRSRSLNAKATALMMEWFEKHIENPYPSDAEKEELARAGGISVPQVKAWFANRRNRTSNTKPKRQKLQVEKKLLTICTELNGDARQPRVYSDIIKQLSDIVSNATMFNSQDFQPTMCDAMASSSDDSNGSV